MCAWTSSVVRGVSLGYLVHVQVAEFGESAIDSSKVDWSKGREPCQLLYCRCE
jgi:hypothetical protein